MKRRQSALGVLPYAEVVARRGSIKEKNGHEKLQQQRRDVAGRGGTIRNCPDS